MKLTKEQRATKKTLERVLKNPATIKPLDAKRAVKFAATVATHVERKIESRSDNWHESDAALDAEEMLLAWDDFAESYAPVAKRAHKLATRLNHQDDLRDLAEDFASLPCSPDDL